MPRKSNRPLREYEVEQRKAGFAGARMAIEDRSRALADIAKVIGTHRHTITMALAVLSHGTSEEIAATESGMAPLRATYTAIMKRVPPEERRSTIRKPAQTENVLGAREIDAGVWKNLRAAIEAVQSLPSPKDTAASVRRNAMRTEYISRNLLVALTWITEFSDEITR